MMYTRKRVRPNNFNDDILISVQDYFVKTKQKDLISITITDARNNVKSFRHWLLRFVLDSGFNKDKSSSAAD